MREQEWSKQQIAEKQRLEAGKSGRGKTKEEIELEQALNLLSGEEWDKHQLEEQHRRTAGGNSAWYGGNSAW